MSVITDTTLNDLIKRIRHSNRVCENISKGVKPLRDENKNSKTNKK